MRLFLALILITQSVYGASIWPNGTRLQTFQRGFLFGNNETLDATTDNFTFSGGGTFQGPFVLEQQSTPTTPSTNFNKLYFKSDNNLYKLNDAAEEVNVSSAVVGGQQQSGAPFPEVRVPNQQVVRTATGVGLIETGNKNLFLNSGFEHQTYSTGWTTSGTATYSAETSAPLSGLKSFKAVASAQTIDLVQDTTLYASARAGSQMFWRFPAKNTAAGVTACVRKNGVKQTGSNDCLALSTDGVTRTYELAFLADGTSNGIEIDAASTTGTLIVDDVELSTESAAFVDVAQIGPWISYTPTFTGFGTVTVQNFRYRINGSSIEIMGRFTADVTSATEARISLPSSFVTLPDFTSTNIAGSYTKGDNPVAASLPILIEPAVSYFNFGRQSASEVGLSKINANAVAGSTERISIQASIPVQGLSNKVSTYSQACTTDVQCENVFSAKVSAAGVVSDENLDFISGNCSGSGLVTCTFNSSIFTVAPNCSISGAGSSGTAIGLTSSSTASTFVIRAFGTTTGNAASQDVHVICTKQGADFKAKNVITGTFQDVVTAPNSGSLKTCRYSFGGSGSLTSPTACTSGACTEYYDQCGIITPPSRSSAGLYTDLTIASGVFRASSYLRCECSAFTTSEIFSCSHYLSSTGDSNLATNASGGAVINLATQSFGDLQTDSFVSVMCEGLAP